MSRIKDYDQLVKLILIGSSGVGKSSLLIQFAENKFNEGYLTTIGVDFRLLAHNIGSRHSRLMGKVSNSKYGTLLDRTDSELLPAPTTREQMESSWFMTSPTPSLLKISPSSGCLRQRTMPIRTSL